MAVPMISVALKFLKAGGLTTATKKVLIEKGITKEFINNATKASRLLSGKASPSRFLRTAVTKELKRLAGLNTYKSLYNSYLDKLEETVIEDKLLFRRRDMVKVVIDELESINDVNQAIKIMKTRIATINVNVKSQLNGYIRYFANQGRIEIVEALLSLKNARGHKKALVDHLFQTGNMQELLEDYYDETNNKDQDLLDKINAILSDDNVTSFGKKYDLMQRVKPLITADERNVLMQDVKTMSNVDYQRMQMIRFKFRKKRRKNRKITTKRRSTKK